MALVKCKECGIEISSSAKACPHCGKAQTKKSTKIIGGLFIIMVAMIVIGSLDSPPSSPDVDRVTSPVPSSGNPAHEQLMRASENSRNITFAAMMMASGEHCGAVTRTFFQGFAGEDAIWNITCTDGRSWGVTVKGDTEGSTRILDCAVLSAVGGGECFTKF